MLNLMQGIWDDSHIAPLKRIVDFVHAQGSKIGIQLAHAGRKASTMQLWMLYTVAATQPMVTRNRANENEGGWPDKGVLSSIYYENLCADLA